MENPKNVKSAVGIAVTVILAAVGLAAVASGSAQTAEPTIVDAAQYTDFIANEALDMQDLAEGAEIQRRMFNRMTPPGFAWVQPMLPPVVPFDAENFDDSFLDGLLGKDKNSVTIYPLSLALDPKTRETLVYNTEGKLIANITADRASCYWPEDADPVRVTLQVDLLPAEDVEPYLYVEGRIAEYEEARTTKTKKSGGMALRSLGAGEFGICRFQSQSNGVLRLTVTNGADVAEIYAYTVWHTSAVVVATWTNEEDEVVTGTNVVWTPVSPSFNGRQSAWECRTTNLALTNGVGIWEDANVSSNARIRFYVTANRMDSDEDVLTDGEEIFLYCTDPENSDSDGDDLADGLEVNDHATNPNNSDTDGDGLPDGWEVHNGLDPHDDGTTNSVNGAAGDLDGDGFSNALEYQLGAPANNPAWNGAELAYCLTHAQPAAGSRSIVTNLIGMRVDVDDSENCGGANDQRQVKVATLHVPDMLAWGYFIDITVDGAVEDKDDYYDQVHVRAFTNTYYYEGNDNQNPCSMAYKSATRNVLILENSTVVLEYDTMSYKHHVGGYAEITAATETGYIKSETAALYPIDRSRTEVGVAEEVDIKIYPSPGGVTWSISGGGALTELSGEETRFIAPSNTAICPVTINFSGHSITKNFGVREPAGVVDAFFVPCTNAIPPGKAGAIMKLRAVIGPTNVSFDHLECLEVGMDATNCTGYFAGGAPSHIGNGADRWFPLNAANQWEDTCAIQEPYVAPPWQNGGSFEWLIPAQWHIGTSGPTNSMSGWNQEFELDAGGTVKITKFGRWIQRTTNNAITYN